MGQKDEGLEVFEVPLDELATQGAQRMIAAAPDAGVEAYLARHRGQRDERGHALVVRNGQTRPRKVTVGSGTMEIEAPRVDDSREGKRFHKQDFAAVHEALAEGDGGASHPVPAGAVEGGLWAGAEGALLGEDSAGLSPANVTRLMGVWEAEYEPFPTRDLSEVDYVYVWVDGSHVNVRLGEQDGICLLVMVGVRPDGAKELVAIEDGSRESKESWADVLRGLKRRGMRAPMLAIGDGALGFWAAAKDVWPERREQRDWVHRLGNVLDKLPKRLQAKAKEALRQMMNASRRAEAKEGMERFEADYGAKDPKAVASLRRDEETLPTFCDFPAEHWKHIRTTNPIESPFATVRLRQRVTKGPGSAKRGCLLAFKLLTMADERWRRLNGAELLPIVRAGVQFEDGQPLEREDSGQQQDTTERAAALSSQSTTLDHISATFKVRVHIAKGLQEWGGARARREACGAWSRN